MYWDDLRYFLALQRHGRLVNAGRSLNVDYTTVSRRVKELESALNTKLFEKKETGFEVTAAGESLVGYAEQIEKKMLGIESVIRADSDRVKGIVRVGAPENINIHFLSVCFPDLLDQHPDLEIDLKCGIEPNALLRNEVDIAITTRRPTSGRFVVSRLQEYRLGLFASREYLDRNLVITSISDLFQHTLINCKNDNKMEAIIQEYSMSKCKRTSLTGRSLSVQYNALRNGHGLCLMPVFMQSEYPELIRVLDKEINIEQTLWLVKDEDVKDINRVKVVSNFISQVFQS